MSEESFQFLNLFLRNVVPNFEDREMSPLFGFRLPVFSQATLDAHFFTAGHTDVNDAKFLRRLLDSIHSWASLLLAFGAFNVEGRSADELFDAEIVEVSGEVLEKVLSNGSSQLQ
jgi:hypothetical protein